MNLKAAKGDLDSKIFDTINIILLVTFTIIIVVPLWNVVVFILQLGQVAGRGRVHLLAYGILA